MSKELISLSSLLLISNILLSIKYFYISVEFFDFDLDNIFIGGNTNGITNIQI